MTDRRRQDIGTVIIGLWLFVSPWVVGNGIEVPAAAWNAYIIGVAIVVFATVAMSIPKAWEEAVNVGLGTWMIVSPWVLDFASHRSVAGNAVIVGVLVTALAAMAMAQDKGFEKWWHDHHPAP